MKLRDVNWLSLSELGAIRSNHAASEDRGDDWFTVTLNAKFIYSHAKFFSIFRHTTSYEEYKWEHKTGIFRFFATSIIASSTIHSFEGTLGVWAGRHDDDWCPLPKSFSNHFTGDLHSFFLGEALDLVASQIKSPSILAVVIKIPAKTRLTDKREKQFRYSRFELGLRND